MNRFKYASNILEMRPEELQIRYSARSLFGLLNLPNGKTATVPIIDQEKGMHLNYNNWNTLGDVVREVNPTSILIYQGSDLKGPFTIKDILLENERLYPKQLTPKTLEMFEIYFPKEHAQRIVDAYNNQKSTKNHKV